MIPGQPHFPFGLLIAFVFLWQTIRAIRTFTPQRGERSVYEAGLIPLSFILMLVGAGQAPMNGWALTLGTVGLVGAMVLFEWAKWATRGRFFSYAFSEDLPTHLCTDGPFATIRNPFYTSYILSLASATVMLPGLVRVSIFVLMLGLFNRAARQEEAKFERSRIAAEYKRYKSRTGRFFPRLH